MRFFHAPITLATFVGVLAAIPSPDCPEDLEAPSPTMSNIQETAYASNFGSFVSSLAGISWVKRFADGLRPAVLKVHKILDDLEGEEDYGGTSLIPLPDSSLYALYEFIVKRKIHCYAAENPKLLVLSLVRIDQATGTGGMSDFVQSDQSSPVDEAQTQADSMINAPDSPGDESNDPRTFFQYTNVDRLKVFSAMVDSYAFQLKQLEDASHGIYSTHEASLLKSQKNFWSQSASMQLQKLWRMFEVGEAYLREPGPWDYNDFEDWIKVLKNHGGDQIHFSDEGSMFGGDDEAEEGEF